MQMALSKPDLPPYSSFMASRNNFHFYVVTKNYQHHHAIEGLMTIRRLLDQKIVTRELLVRFTANYLQDALDTVNNEVVAESSETTSITKIFNKFAWDCFALSDMLDRRTIIERSSEEDPSPNTYYGRAKIEMDELLVSLPEFIRSVLMPLLLRIDECNRSLYLSYRIGDLPKRISACTTFRQLAEVVVPNFFYFACYTTKVQRLQVLELTIRMGNQLLPGKPMLSYGEAPDWTDHCACCFWVFLQYCELANVCDYNMSFKRGQTEYQARNARHIFIAYMDGMHAQLVKFNKKTSDLTFHPDQFEMNKFSDMGRYFFENHCRDSIFKAWRGKPATPEMLQRKPLMYYTLYALDFLSTADRKLNQVRARTNDLLMHVAPLFSLDFACAIAFASGLHPRLGGSEHQCTKTVLVEQGEAERKRKRPQYKRVTFIGSSPIFLLEEDIVRKIWRYAAPHFENTTESISRRKHIGSIHISRSELKKLAD